ncbi:hypothetical protein XENTR_v10015771 [Xenopus tropicalis]|nr:hypothetical protein XENTR_v10015771 [Xenopus tropicalis]
MTSVRGNGRIEAVGNSFGTFSWAQKVPRKVNRVWNVQCLILDYYYYIRDNLLAIFKTVFLLSYKKEKKEQSQHSINFFHD